MEYSMEKASRADLAEILTLQKKAFGQVAALLNCPGLPALLQTEQEIGEEFEKSVILKCSCKDGRIVGSVRAFADEENACHIGKLIVDPDFQGKGIGRALMGEIEKNFPACRRYRLFTSEETPWTSQLYRTLGYQETGRRPMGGTLMILMDKENPALAVSAKSALSGCIFSGTEYSIRQKAMMRLLEFWKAESVRFDAICFDIDGTLVYGPRALPGAVELIDLLRRDGTPFLFLTNDGDHTRKQKCGFLNRAGIRAEENEIVSCLSVLPELARLNGWDRDLLFQVGRVGDSEGLKLECDLAKIGECRGVLMGEGLYDWKSHWEALIDFFKLHPGAPFIVPNPDTCWPNAATGGIGVGAGGQARCIQLLLREMGFEINPLYLGKPYPAIYDFAARKLGLSERARILCVGDSLASDILGANQAGMHSALVLSGITSQQQAENAIGKLRPNIVCSAV